MAAALWRIRWPFSGKAELKEGRAKRADPAIRDLKANELEEAKEILAEIFAIDMLEVEEMIRDRLEERSEWPQILWLESQGGRSRSNGT
jgi:hypothetical protein